MIYCIMLQADLINSFNKIVMLQVEVCDCQCLFLLVTEGHLPPAVWQPYRACYYSI